MLGLGLGGYIAGAWADRKYREAPESLLRAYAHAEILIAALGLLVALALPHLGPVSAAMSSYVRDAGGWYVLSTGSYAARAGLAVALLLPSALLMGATLTLLIRHLVRADPRLGHWRIAALYAVNTLGAACGCVMTDFALVPALGLRDTQVVAVALNAMAGAAVWLMTRRGAPAARAPGLGVVPRPPRSGRVPVFTFSRLAWTSLAIAMAGFAAMGMEMLWFRHISILLGGFRTVFSLLLAVILVGIGAGALLGGVVGRRTSRPAEAFMLVQGLFVVATLVALGAADSGAIGASVAFDPAMAGATGFAGTARGTTGWARALAEGWFNVRPIAVEVAVPALLMGFSFPLANAMVQQVEGAVGRRSGLLYLSNTAGAVTGSLAAGFVLMPWLGIQASATALCFVAALSIVPLWSAGSTPTGRTGAGATVSAAASVALCAVALGWWLQLPADFVNARALDPPSLGERRLVVDEGLTELISVTEVEGQGRRLVTNGHAMSATTRLSQRYMRALAHLPLLAMDAPHSALVIGFGVGNTTHAVTLHPTIARVDVADLSRGVLSHAAYFTSVNQNVLADPRVSVYLNDGRQHLQMQAERTYDLITLEPPPIAFAGVSALYSKEFYALARSRLTARGYLSQWLPAYQVPTEATLGMVRAFVDVFPQAVLVSGAEADLILIGTTDASVAVDPVRLLARLSASPAVRTDLARLDLGTPREIVGTFVASAQLLAEATRVVAPLADDRPLLEYSVRSALNLGDAVPSALVDLSRVAEWCPTCFTSDMPVPAVAGVDLYLSLLDLAYRASPGDLARTRRLPNAASRTVAGSAYLGAVVPESAEVHNLIGISLALRGAMDEAIVEFRAALGLDPESAQTHWHLGAALASRGSREEAIAHLRQSVEIDPSNEDARNDLRAVTGR
jgi:spermidine synthase